MIAAAEQLRAFDGFVELVSVRVRGGDYAPRLRKTLNPFLADPAEHARHVDVLLELYGIVSLGAAARWMRGMLHKPLLQAARQLDALLQELPAGSPERTVMAELAQRLADPRAALADDPRRYKQALDAFLAAPDQHARPVGMITDAYASAWLGGQFPLARPILPLALRSKQSRRWKSDLEQCRLRLRQRLAVATGEAPAQAEMEFPLVLKRPFPDEYDGYADRYRCVAVTARLRLEPDEGCRLQQLRFDLGLPETAHIDTVDATLASDTSERQTTTVHTDRRVTTDGRDRAVNLGLSVQGPLATGASVSLGASSKREHVAGVERESRITIKDGMQLTATAMDQTARLDVLVVDDELPAPGDGGLPLYAKLAVNALVPVADDWLDVTGRFEFRAGWYEGMGEGGERLELPRPAPPIPAP